MKEQLREVEKHIQPGLTRYTWLSLGIEEYARDALNKLRNVTSRVNQMQDVTVNVDKKILSLGSFDLFSFPPSTDLISRLPCKVGMKELQDLYSYYKVERIHIKG